MPEAIWFLFNVIVGIPAAVVLVGLCREILRVLFALALGFRVFELKWGAGRRLWAKPIGPVEVVLGTRPIVASIIAESGSPQHHRLGRLVQAGGPLLIQLAGGYWGRANGLLDSQALRSDFAPLAVLHFANILLIALHGLIPLETRAGFRTDIRALLDISFGRAEANRHARANYYARYARHWLERGDVERAKAVLEGGLTQLGRDSLLVASQTRILAEDLSSVIDQSDCADALRVLIMSAAQRRRRDRDTSPMRARIRQAAITALPLALATFGFAVIESERFSQFVHDRWIATGNRVAEDAIASVCEVQLARWQRWSSILDLSLPSSPEIRRDRHDQLARLERCRGRPEAAAAHQSLAISAAQRALAPHAGSADSAPDPWLANEVRLAILLRHAAELDGERGRYRLALAALGRAEQGLDLARNKVATLRPHASDFQTRAQGRLEGEKAELELARLRVLTQMSAR